MLISIIITTKNEERNIRNCLESVLSQDYPKDKLEIIVVDNNSTDKTKEIAIRFPKVKLFTIHWQQDFSKARNESLKHASGDWILILDADEELDELGKKRIKFFRIPLG